ncbi:phasin: phasin family protein [Tepidimonas alkaliphilus]|uniref:Phasin: phasin family protein n=1 Tax=Tepidimonas alkaliphilus TaxID=2588942 RepID=A0A554W8E4_9BURK|nr:phasin family protein [Tepidimonas alkaliphilus]TSE19848.1 phasin: phasin family protein [Tepidimonas alkaliphilus]
MLTPEQLAAVHKAHAETLFGLTRQALEGVEKLVELNLQATRAALRDAADQTQALLSVRDAQQLLQQQAALIQPLAEKTLDYSRRLMQIVQDTGGALAQAAEEQSAQAQAKLQAVVENVARNAPAGTEPAVETLRHTVQAATQAVAAVQQALRQAADLAERQAEAASEQVHQAATDLAQAIAPQAGSRARAGRRSG